MKARYALGILLFLIGCRAPAPMVDPFAGYGPRVIPPPATGSIGGAGAYYATPPAGGTQPAPPATFNPVGPTTPTPGGMLMPPQTGYDPGPGAWQSVPQYTQSSPIQGPRQVSFEAPLNRSSPSILPGTPPPAGTSGLRWGQPAPGQSPPDGWSASPATFSQPMPTQIPSLSLTAPAQGLELAPQYIPPIRPSVVRPMAYDASTEGRLIAGVPADACCEPVTGPVVPLPLGVTELQSGPVAPAIYTSTVTTPDRWRRR